MKAPAALLNRLRSVDAGQTDTFNTYEYGLQGGYEWIEALSAIPNATAVPSWGSRGWDAGSWPLIVIGWHRHGDTYSLLTYVEGDVTVTAHASSDALVAATDEAVAFHWRNGQSLGPSDLPEDTLPDKYRGPYKRARATAGGA